jgi:predicted metal-binding membrane protein
VVSAAQSLRRPFLVRLTPQIAVILLLGSAAAAVTIIRADGRWDMPGTMGYALPAFMGMWALMMAGMMLPSVAPFASMYSRTVTERRFPRLVLFAAGYLAVWALMGIPAFGLARLADEYAGGTVGTALAAGAFAACGIYQLTPLKHRCLSHCRTPMSHLLKFASHRGRFRDLRSGFEHGYFCAACCWGLMVLLVAFGVMNVPAMILLAAVVATEKIWRWGERFSRAVGVAALAAAVLVIWIPELAPGLTNEPMDAMAADSMMDGEPMGDSMK